LKLIKKFFCDLRDCHAEIVSPARVLAVGSEGEGGCAKFQCLEPIRKLLESDESDMIPCQALDSLESARCGNLSTAVRRIELAFVTRVI
jgi:hypothetical protein